MIHTPGHLTLVWQTCREHIFVTFFSWGKSFRSWKLPPASQFQLVPRPLNGFSWKSSNARTFADNLMWYCVLSYSITWGPTQYHMRSHGPHMRQGTPAGLSWKLFLRSWGKNFRSWKLTLRSWQILTIRGSTRKCHLKTQAARGFDHHDANIRSDQAPRGVQTGNTT